MKTAFRCHHGQFLPMPFAVLLLVLAAGTMCAAGGEAAVTLLTRGPDGRQARRGARAIAPAVSQDGRYVSFESDAVDYVQCRGTYNVFVKDMLTAQVELVSRSTGGIPGNGFSNSSTISGDGRFVAFISASTNLIDGVQSPPYEVYLRDRVAGSTERISVPADGSTGKVGARPGLRLSQDGRYVLYIAGGGNALLGNPTGSEFIVLFDRINRTAEDVGVNSDGTRITWINLGGMDMTPDAAYVVFTDHVSGRMEPEGNVWLRDRNRGLTTQVNTSASGHRQGGYWQYPSISSDGRLVLLDPLYSDLEVRNLITRETETYQELSSGELSPDGTTILYPSSEGPRLFDRATRQSEPILPMGTLPSTVVTTEEPANTVTASSWFGNGNNVVFTEFSDLIAGDQNGQPDIYLARRSPPSLRRVSVMPDGSEPGAPAASGAPEQSPDGRYVVFVSDVRALVSGSSDPRRHVYLLDRSTGVFERVSVSISGEPGNADSWSDTPLQVSANGRYVVFHSSATNLVAGEPVRRSGPFIRDRLLGTTTRFSPVPPDTYIQNSVSMSDDGRLIAYATDSAVFVHDQALNRSERVSIDLFGRPLRGYAGSWALSGDGKYLFFRMFHPDAVRSRQLYYRDLQRRHTVQVLADQGPRGTLSTNTDGRFVTYWVVSSRRGKRSDHVFLFDRVKRRHEHISLPPAGMRLSDAHPGKISPDGRFVAFQSYIPVPDGVQPHIGVFLRDRQLQQTELISRRPDGSPADWSYGFESPSVSRDGNHVIFECSANDLVEDVDIGGTHIYARDR